MIRLAAISLPSLPGSLGSLGCVRCDEPGFKMKGWRISIRGPMVFLISPAGWTNGAPPASFDPTVGRRIFEVPMVECILQWDCDEDPIKAVDSMAKHDAPPMGETAKP